MSDRPLAGVRIVTTRDERGRLDSRLASAGADVVHVPLIEIVPPEFAVRSHPAISALSSHDWLITTSRHGAEAVGSVAASTPSIRLAAVGTRTARRLAELAGRPVDVVPDRQNAVGLVAAMPSGPASAVVAQADRADHMLVDGLRERGFDVEVVTAYRTILRTPSLAERSAALGADAVVFASGSAAEGWSAAFGPNTPPVVVAIGPTTAAAAADVGIVITHVATDHSVDGLVETVIGAMTRRS